MGMSNITSKFDSALTAATIDQSSIELAGHMVSVTIDGQRYTNRAEALTVEGVKGALADALRDHCALAAVK